MKKRGIWRDPPEESKNLFPHLVVHDDRVTGSITAGASRLPLWCFVGFMALEGWGGEVAAYDPDQYGWTKERMAEFLGSLLDQRGEFARLLLVLADVERRDRNRMERGDDRPWHQVAGQRGRVVRQLRRCLEVLEAERQAYVAAMEKGDG